jgi:hypothetical protein
MIVSVSPFFWESGQTKAAEQQNKKDRRQRARRQSPPLVSEVFKHPIFPSVTNSFAPVSWNGYVFAKRSSNLPD